MENWKTSYDDYVIQNGDDIQLTFGDNPVVSLNTNFGSLVFELFEDETPGTVENFLNYVNDGTTSIRSSIVRCLAL